MAMLVHSHSRRKINSPVRLLIINVFRESRCRLISVYRGEDVKITLKWTSEKKQILKHTEYSFIRSFVWVLGLLSHYGNNFIGIISLRKLEGRKPLMRCRQGRGVHVTGVSAAYTFKLNKNILSE
jgi:hypothetical protein